MGRLQMVFIQAVIILHPGLCRDSLLEADNAAKKPEDNNHDTINGPRQHFWFPGGKTTGRNSTDHTLPLSAFNQATGKARHLLGRGITFLWAKEEPKPAVVRTVFYVEMFSAMYDPVEKLAWVLVGSDTDIRCQNANTCRFTGRSPSDPPVDVPGKLIYGDMAAAKLKLSTMCILTCPVDPAGGDKAVPASVTLLNSVGLPESDTIRIDRIAAPESPTIGVGVCVGPVYSEMPQMSDWIEHLMLLNVSAVWAYAPFYTAAEWIDHRTGQAYRPPTMFSHRALHWTVYRSLTRGHYHSQTWVYNDCLYRHRHEAEFILVADADEFLHFHAAPVTDLFAWLNQVTPSDVVGTCGLVTEPMEYAAVRCHRHWHVPINAPSGQQRAKALGYQGVQYERAQLFNRSLVLGENVYRRICPKSKHCRTKCAVRPLAVIVYHVHYPWPGYVHPAFKLEQYLPASQLLFLHHRCSTGKEWGSGLTHVHHSQREKTA